MASSKSEILKANKKISLTFLIFIQKGCLTPQMKANKFLFQNKLHSLTNFVLKEFFQVTFQVKTAKMTYDVIMTSRSQILMEISGDLSISDTITL